MPQAPPELIVVARSDAGLQTSEDGAAIATARSFDATPLADLLTAEGIVLEPLFGLNEVRARGAVIASLTTLSSADVPAETLPEVPDFAKFYYARLPEGADTEQLEQIASRLRGSELIEAAFVKPPAEPPLPPDGDRLIDGLNNMPPDPNLAPPATPDFTARQGYLRAAPGGVDAVFAHSRPGGQGTDVRIIDVEGAWRLSHEDLRQNSGGLVSGTMSADIGWRNHGTAVVGVMGADRNTFGITGICPDAVISVSSLFGAGQGSARAIIDAAMKLRPGDLLLLELHRPGPRHNFQARPQDQLGYIAIEWWPDDLAAIQFAVRRGVIVVEAAGNGAENLDDPIYDAPAAGFPASWRNPFRRAPVDSGAVVVGAGAPPSGNFGPDRSRLGFSNFGALVDAQGWGREVVTCGYGDLQGGANEDYWYTAHFSGTSSASPVVVGALACLQGMLRAAGRQPLTPADARQVLRSTGSPQQNGPNGPATQRIGNRPDLRALFTRIFGAAPQPGVIVADPVIRGILERLDRLEQAVLNPARPPQPGGFPPRVWEPDDVGEPAEGDPFARVPDGEFNAWAAWEWQGAAPPQAASQEAALEAFLDSLGLRFFSGREFTPYWGRVRNGARNSVPPRSLWPNIARTMVLLDRLRGEIGSPIHLLSTYRSPAYNAAIGGAGASAHMEFRAVDFRCSAGTPQQWAARLRSYRGQTFRNPHTGDPFVFRGGIGVYSGSGFVHLDTRGYDADWSG